MSSVVLSTSEIMNASSDTDSKFPLWFHLLNLLLIIIAFGFLAVYIGLSFINEPPYDYAILMFGSEAICFDQEFFVYGEYGIHYPASFYATFCAPYHYLPEVFLSVWMLIPFILSLWVARGRAAVLAFPPLFILLLLGQSSGLIMPLYMVAIAYSENPKKPVKWWYGLIFGLGALKPHVALPAFFYLVYKWRHHWKALATGFLVCLAMVIPAFILEPNWVFDWLANTRGFQPVNLANLAKIPVRLFDIEFSPDPMVNLGVWLYSFVMFGLVFSLLKWRRKNLEFYDYVLIYLFTIPAINDYDVIVLLPLIAHRPRRLLLALVAGIATWLYTMMQFDRRMAYGGGQEFEVVWNMSIYVTLVLLFDRFLRLNQGVLDQPLSRIPLVPAIFEKKE